MWFQAIATWARDCPRNHAKWKQWVTCCEDQVLPSGTATPVQGENGQIRLTSLRAVCVRPPPFSVDGLGSLMAQKRLDPLQQQAISD